MADPAMWNTRMETLGAAELHAQRSTLLQRQLRYVAERSPFYRRKWAEAGVRPEQVRTPADLHHLPFTYKDELRQSQMASPPLGEYVCAQREDIIRIHSSSGTTGRPSYVGLTHHDRANWEEMVARCLYASGLRRRSTIVYAFSIGFFVGGLANHDAIELIGATLIPVGVGYTDRLVSSIVNLQADAITCTPSYAAYLAQHIREKAGLDPRELSVRTFIVGGEPGGGVPGTRRLLEEAWNARVYDAMGNADVAPVYLGECPAQAGMHFMGQEYILPEIIDPDTGASLPLADQVQGELVVTHLDRECSPLVRFRTADRVEVDGRPCTCGRTSFRLRCVGRVDDMLIVRGVNVFPAAIKDVVSQLRPRTTGEMVVELDAPGPRVEPPVRLLVEHGSVDAPELPRLKDELEGLLRDRLIFRAQVELVPPGTLPRYEMKARLVRLCGQ